MVEITLDVIVSTCDLVYWSSNVLWSFDMLVGEGGLDALAFNLSSSHPGHPSIEGIKSQSSNSQCPLRRN